MGRKRMELRRIEDRTSRQIRFSKRRGGLFKKACELSILCDAEIALIVFSPAGKLFEYSSVNSMQKTIDRYQKFSRDDIHIKMDVTNKQFMAQQSDGQGSAYSGSNFGVLQTEKWIPERSNMQLTMDDLANLENQFYEGLDWIISMKKQLMTNSLSAVPNQENSSLKERMFLESVGVMGRSAEQPAQGGDAQQQCRNVLL